MLVLLLLSLFVWRVAVLGDLLSFSKKKRISCFVFSVYLLTSLLSCGCLQPMFILSFHWFCHFGGPFTFEAYKIPYTHN